MLNSQTLTSWEQPGITTLAQRYSRVHRLFQTANESMTPTMTSLYPAEYSTISDLALFPSTKKYHLVSAGFSLATVSLLSWLSAVEVQASPEKSSLDNQQSTLFENLSSLRSAFYTEICFLIAYIVSNATNKAHYNLTLPLWVIIMTFRTNFLQSVKMLVI